MAREIVATPVEVDLEESAGPIIIAFIVVLILVGIVAYIYFKSHHNTFDQGGGHLSPDITNHTALLQTLHLPDKSTLAIPPHQTSGISAAQHSVITAESENFDGSKNKHNYRLSNPTISHLHITNSGFRSNITVSKDVDFVNSSPDGVLFIEKSTKGGRRWLMDRVPPFGVTKNHIVPKGTTIQVSDPAQEDSPIATLAVGGNVHKIIFDGIKLISE